MNERIRELAIKAGYQEDLFGIGHWDMPECQKFAELIILECAKVCDSIDDEYDGEDVLATWCADAIKKHFGVEE